MSWVTECLPGCAGADSSSSLPDPFLGWFMCMVCGAQAPVGDRLRDVPPIPVATWVPRRESLLTRKLEAGSVMVSLAATFCDGLDLVVHAAEPSLWPECRGFSELAVAAARSLLEGRMALRPLVVSWDSVVAAGLVSDSRLLVSQPARLSHWAAL